MKMMRLEKIGVLSACLLIAACAGGAQVSKPPSGAQKLSAAEIAELLKRELLLEDGFDGGSSYRTWPNGRLLGTSRTYTNKQVEGAWKLEGDRLCTRWGSDSFNCYPLYRLAAATYYTDVPEQEPRQNTLTLR